LSNDTINRYLNSEKSTPRLIWETAKSEREQNVRSRLIFDDTVLNKKLPKKIELVRRQYRGNEQMPSATLRERVIRGIGLISCISVKQITGLEACQCRQARIKRHHIAGA
jgi:hypothetical protein